MEIVKIRNITEEERINYDIQDPIKIIELDNGDKLFCNKLFYFNEQTQVFELIGDRNGL